MYGFPESGGRSNVPRMNDKMVESGEHVDINVAEFLSVAIFLSEECGKIIRNVKESGDLGQVSKDDTSPVTVADLKVQKTLEVNFKALFPTLHVQGEESKESIENVESSVNADQITDGVKKFIKADFLAAKHQTRMDMIKNELSQTYSTDDIAQDTFETFNTKDAVVWIDPLDGTSEFVNGNLPAVTVLIGLSINNKSRLGIVHNPYTEEDQAVGKTVFGSGEFGCLKVVYDKNMTGEQLLARNIECLEPFNHLEEPADDTTVRVAASLTHFNERMQSIIETVKPVEIVRIGGAGNKCCHIALGTVDTYMHPSPGLKYWDLCAPESLIKGMGGYATDLYQERLTYPLEGDRKIRGLILGKNPPMYNLVKRRMGDLLNTIVQTVKL